MANCKKCGTEITNAVFVKSQTAGAVSEKFFSNGDAIIAINEKNVKNQADIKKAIEENKFFRIKILHKDKNISTTALIPVVYLNDVTFKEDYVCLNCGAKKKRNKISLILCLFFIIFITFMIFILLKNKRKISEQMPEITTATVESKIQGKNEENNLLKVQVLTEQQKEKIETDIAKKKMELNLSDKNEEPRYEEIPETETEENEYNEELHKKLEERYLELFEANTEEADNPFEGVTSGGPNEKKSKGGEGLGANTTKSDKPAVDKAVRISFDYGSCLNANNIYMAYYLQGSQSIETSADIEYAEFYLALDELLKSIPENKRNKAVFLVVGYADSSYKNGVPDEGAESAKFNTDLSFKRAEAVVNMLITEENISPNRILEPEGRGFENRIFDGKKENHEKSRRVEVFCYAK